jgi:hypothetical protein
MGFSVIDMSQSARKITYLRCYFADGFLDSPLIAQIQSKKPGHWVPKVCADAELLLAGELIQKSPHLAGSSDD